ncbi:chemotaxis protein CheW [Caldibacillus lycopersici]|uniref:Chemotaxis protein CheW n=1 Tax=Perspicuibacillus lycopersici TaxID=1325689 RepID=A0AAE3ISH7_9BACI|nr:chemotaxis protein CheW [Perspicuibacillus lycopersici]MCU9613805.1 chemotaxis protein CheW [Perspicuibacillus lycopersici]
MNASNIVVFRSGSEMYGVLIENIVSIEKSEKTTDEYDLPVYVKGFVNSGAEEVPVIDFQTVLYPNKETTDETARCIVVKADLIQLAFFVSEVIGIKEVGSGQLQQVKFVTNTSKSIFSAIAMIENQLIPIVDPVKFIHYAKDFATILSFMKEKQSVIECK